MDTRELLAIIEQRTGATSTYALGKLFDVPPNYVTYWRQGREMGEAHLPRAAELAGLPLAYVVLEIAAARVQGHARDAIRQAAAGLVLLLVAVFVSFPFEAMAIPHQTAWKQEVIPKTEYYVKRALRALFRLKERVCMSLQGAILWTCKHATR